MFEGGRRVGEGERGRGKGRGKGGGDRVAEGGGWMVVGVGGWGRMGRMEIRRSSDPVGAEDGLVSFSDKWFCRDFVVFF